MKRPNPISLWETTSQEQDITGQLRSDQVVDVAIVGGGFTGLSTALHCSERNLSAHVLEAQQIGYGGSGRNVGLVNAASWLPPAKVIQKLGAGYGDRFLKRFGDGPETVFNLIEKHQIRCEAVRSGTIHAAHAPSGVRDLEARHQEWRRLAAPVELLSREEMAERTGTKAFHGGLLDHRAGTINPMGYCRGLARAAKSAGAEISTGVTVSSLKRDGEKWKVETNAGVLTAKNIVLGTNAYTDALWPGLSKVFTTIHYFQFATSPLGPEAAHILPGRQGLWDTNPIMFNYRRDAANRLLIGSMGRVIGSKDRGISRRWTRRQIEKVFPDLGPVNFEEAWHGQIAMTPDHLPYILQLDEGVWTSIGYNGRGITTGTIFGQALSELLTGSPVEELPLPVTKMKPAPRAELMRQVYDLAFTANQIWKSF